MRWSPPQALPQQWRLRADDVVMFLCQTSLFGYLEQFFVLEPFRRRLWLLAFEEPLVLGRHVWVRGEVALLELAPQLRLKVVEEDFEGLLLGEACAPRLLL